MTQNTIKMQAIKSKLEPQMKKDDGYFISCQLAQKKLDIAMSNTDKANWKTKNIQC
jgi:hypothetical protein